jgi:hypothetical protein
MTNPVSGSSSPSSIPVEAHSIPQICSELRANLLEVSQNLQDLLNQPGKLGNDQFVTQVQQNVLALSTLVTKATQC